MSRATQPVRASRTRGHSSRCPNTAESGTVFTRRTSKGGTGNRGYIARHSRRKSRNRALAGDPFKRTPRLSRDRGSRLTGARRARPERASPTVRPLVSSPAPPPGRCLSVGFGCSRTARRERDGESVCASVDGEEGSRRAGHKVGGRYIGGGWKGTRARRGCAREEERRGGASWSKETRTPRGKNGSARVRKEIYGRWFQISRDRERMREEKGGRVAVNRITLG